MKSAGLFMLATALTTNACFTQLPTAGQTSTGVSFTDTDFLGQWTLTPHLSAINLCVNKQGAIDGFQATVALLTQARKFIREEPLTPVGDISAGCTLFSLDYANGEQLYEMTLAWNQKSIKGIGLLTTQQKSVEVGVFRNMPSKETLKFDDRVVGFYGTQEPTFVNSLGGLIYTCTAAESQGQSAGDEQQQSVVQPPLPLQSELPEKSKSGFVALVLFLFLLAALTVVFLVRFRHCIKTTPQKVQKLCATNKQHQGQANAKLATVKASGAGTSTNEISLQPIVVSDDEEAPTQPIQVEPSKHKSPKVKGNKRTTEMVIVEPEQLTKQEVKTTFWQKLLWCCWSKKTPVQKQEEPPVIEQPVKSPPQAPLRVISPTFSDCPKEKEIVKVIGCRDPVKKFRQNALAKVKVPELVTPVQESQYVEGYRVSGGVVIETTLYDKYKRVNNKPNKI